MQKQYSIIINAPIKNAFAAVTEKEKVERWMEGRVKHVFKETHEFNDPVGTKFHESILGLVELDGEIISYIPPREFGLGMEVSGLKGTIFYSLAAMGEKTTKMVFNLEIFDLTAAKKILLKSLYPLFDQIIKKHLKSLKKLGEE